jgi:hypothetical protein
MQTVLITIISPARRIDLKLPSEVPMGDLLPKILEMCGLRQVRIDPTLWRLVIPKRNLALPPARSLRDCGVVDGAILYLQDSAAFLARQQEAMASTFQPRVLKPDASTGGIGVKWNIPPNG